MMKKVLPLFLIAFFAVIGCDNPNADRENKNGDKKAAHDHDHDHAHDHDHDHDHSHDSGSTDEETWDAYPGTTGGEFLFDLDSIEAGPGVTEYSPKNNSAITLVAYDAPQQAEPQPFYGQQRANRPTGQATAFPAIVGPPRIFWDLPEDIHNPDGLTVSEDGRTLYMCCPNFNGRENDKGPKKNGGFLLSFNLQGRPQMEKLLEFPPLEETGQFGCMGLDFGPDGHLYVCDNQYFFNPDHKSRIVRVLMNGKKPTGKIEVVATGMKLANAILWMKDKLLVTDTFLELEGKWGSGGIWAFTKEEALKAGRGDNPPIALKPNGTDPHLALVEESENIGRGDNAGADGMTCTPDGVVYFGNFGDGAMYRVVFDKNLKATVEKIHKAGEVFSCCDGIFYDKRTNKIYINDSEKNAIRAFKPVKAGEKPKFEVIWENGDTDGTDGLLDQPCECVVVGQRMIICNFDWPFPGLLNASFDTPYTMSEITLK